MPLLNVHNPDRALNDSGAPSIGEFLSAPGEAVRLSPVDDPADLAPHLDRIQRIEIEFPKYTDGRGFSQAQLLRRRHGYAGELRAVGHVLRDQAMMMVRCGFDVLETSRADLSEIEKALSTYRHAYQSAADARPSVFTLRHDEKGSV